MWLSLTSLTMPVMMSGSFSLPNSTSLPTLKDLMRKVLSVNEREDPPAESAPSKRNLYAKEPCAFFNIYYARDQAIKKKNLPYTVAASFLLEKSRIEVEIKNGQTSELFGRKMK